MRGGPRPVAAAQGEPRGFEAWPLGPAGPGVARSILARRQARDDAF